MEIMWAVKKHTRIDRSLPFSVSFARFLSIGREKNFCVCLRIYLFFHLKTWVRCIKHIEIKTRQMIQLIFFEHQTKDETQSLNSFDDRIISKNRIWWASFNNCISYFLHCRTLKHLTVNLIEGERKNVREDKVRFVNRKKIESITNLFGLKIWESFLYLLVSEKLKVETIMLDLYKLLFHFKDIWSQSRYDVWNVLNCEQIERMWPKISKIATTFESIFRIESIIVFINQNLGNGAAIWANILLIILILPNNWLKISNNLSSATSHSVSNYSIISH